MVRRILLGGLTLILVSAVLGLPRSARAAEVQVAFDPAGRIQRIDASLAQRIGLFFDKYPDFQEARLFMAADSSFVLEVSTLHGGQLAREREVLTREQADALRADIVRRVGSLAPVSEKLNQEGRPLLLAGASVLGLGFYGWAVPYIFDTSDPTVALGSYMLTAGASFFVPLVLTQNQPVTWSMTSLSLYGSTRGIAHGLLLEQIAQPGNGSDSESRTAVAVAMATSLGEGALGYAIAGNGRMSAGTAEAIVNGGDYGLLWGYLFSDIVGYTDQDEGRSVAISMLATTVAGMAGAHVLARHRAYSYGDGLVMRSSGYLGMLIATAVVDVGQPQDKRDFGDSKAYSAGLLAGSAVGILVGDRLVLGREFTAGEGVLVQLGGAAGALTGLGLVAIANPQGTNSSSAYWFGAAIGGAAGYALTYGQLSRKATARSADRMSWRFEFAPEGVLAAMGRSSGAGATRGGRSVPTLARLSCRF